MARTTTRRVVRLGDSTIPVIGTDEPTAAAGGGGERIGSTHDVISGARSVKGYPITRDELFGLGGAGFVATAGFSLGGNYLTRYYDIQKDLDMAQGLPDRIVVKWQTKAEQDWTFGILLIIFGIVAIFAGGAKITSIILSTKHPR